VPPSSLLQDMRSFRRHAKRVLAAFPPFRRLARGTRARATKASIVRRFRPVRWGNLRRLTPISSRYGRDRGTPVDRVLLDEFFASHRADIHGRVLEVRDPGFTGRFGLGIERVDIVDIDPTNERATILADLASPGSLPEATFDCAIVPQTLQYVSDLEAACRNLWHALAPGGVLLVSVPVISKLDHHLREVDRWRVTPTGLTSMLTTACPGAEIAVSSAGNVLLATAFLMGVSAEELRADELTRDDPDFPIVAFARVRRPPEASP
jgi:SAM-dependent methyltransferase